MITLRMTPGAEAAFALTEVKTIAWRYPGEHELRLLVGDRVIELGPMWTYDASPACLAALGEFGRVTEPRL